MRQPMLAARLSAALVTTLAAAGALAGPTVNLSADARARVANDEMVVVLAAERDHSDPAVATDAVVRSMNDAIEQAKRVSGVTARVGRVGTQPNYNPQGKPNGYRVRGEVVLESNNFSELAALSGTLSQRMQLAGVTFRASGVLRDREEQRLLGDAANQFRARAMAITRAFGQRDYEIRSMTVSTPSSGGVRPMMADVATMRAAAPLPTEGGDTELVVSISGAIELR